MPGLLGLHLAGGQAIVSCGGQAAPDLPRTLCGMGWFTQQSTAAPARAHHSVADPSGD